jgi:protoporphyrinogen/coproporphyrinogen III oxidase
LGKRIAIIGGGISGLTAAFTLEKARQAGVPVDYCLFESTSRVGGVLRTEHVEGCIVEAGPDSFLTEKSWAIDFCREIGLGDQLISSNDAERKTYIYLKGRLIPLPDGLAFLVPTKIWPIVSSPLFSVQTKLRMAGEWFFSPRQSVSDESVADFVARHYGLEMVDRLADPMLTGVYGGSPSQLSVQSVLSRFVEMEKSFGSLGKGMIGARKKISHTPLPIFTSLKGGMQQMVDALSTKISVASMRLNSRINSVEFINGEWIVLNDRESGRFDAVILAVPAYIAASIMENSSTDLARLLREIPYSSSITVAMGFDRTFFRELPKGFGFLVPRSEEMHTLAATFVHQKFPFRAPSNLALVRCFMGGSRDEQIFELDDEASKKIAQEELRQILRIDAEPGFTRIFKWKNAMPQYFVGHKQRLEQIESLASQLPKLALVGNAYSGIGIPDCIRSGQNAASRMLTALALQ